MTRQDVMIAARSRNRQKQEIQGSKGKSSLGGKRYYPALFGSNLAGVFTTLLPIKLSLIIDRDYLYSSASLSLAEPAGIRIYEVYHLYTLYA